MTSPVSTGSLVPGAVVAEPRGTAAIDRRPRLAAYLAGGVVTAVFLALSVVGVAPVVLAPGVGAGATTYALLASAAILAIQLGHFSRPTAALDSTVSLALLAVLAVFVYVPTLTFGQSWIGLQGFLVGDALLARRSRPGWIGFAVTLAGVGIVQWLLSGSLLDLVYSVVGNGTIGLIVYLLSRFTRMVAELHAARSELARRAVAEQRLNFARDLHDLLGLSLSAIALKGELVHRLLRKSADQARDELAEITGIAQRTLADVRTVARGYRELSLERESRTAESLLAASDIAVQVHLEQDALPVRARTTLAKVLRAGVTNVLRHSDVEHCEISVRRVDSHVTLEIANDGVMLDSDLQEVNAGAAELAKEVAELGGTVRSGSGPDGRFRMQVDLPVREETEKKPEPSEADDRSKADVTLVRGGLTAAFSGMCLTSILHTVYLTSSAWEIALSIGYLSALLVLQLSYFNRPSTRLRSAQSYGLLFVQACLIYLPLLALKQNWVSLPGLLSGNGLLVLPPALGWPLLVLTAGGTVLIESGLGVSASGVVFGTTSIVMSSLIVFGLVWLVRLVTDLDSTRRRLAEMAVAEERLRFARDLHDLLGMSLSAIALKSELTSRVLSIDRGKAREELVEILGLARQALADVRSVASGYRELSLDSETKTARSVLLAADVHVRMEVAAEGLPAPVRTVLAVVLREAVTNVLRHSKVENCEVLLNRSGDGVTLDILNDGVPTRTAEPDRAPERGDASGSGIGNMSERVGSLGGKLTAGVEPDGRFRLRAVVPV